VGDRYVWGTLMCQNSWMTVLQGHREKTGLVQDMGGDQAVRRPLKLGLDIGGSREPLQC
jgi:hypothetical protein